MRFSRRLNRLEVSTRAERIISLDVPLSCTLRRAGSLRYVQLHKGDVRATQMLTYLDHSKESSKC